MTTTLWQEILQSLNEEMRKENRKIILFVDNASCHKSEHLSNIKLEFLPPNTTQIFKILIILGWDFDIITTVEDSASYIHCDDDVACYGDLSEGEIVAAVTYNSSNAENEELEDEEDMRKAFSGP
ncbi:uncharacterized protein [Musca autumnalis]|uniref:uncharacterized protein n=1 Tax=Musca autumnalis TaxID=221902 RepID=UPI003CEA3336